MSEYKTMIGSLTWPFVISVDPKSGIKDNLAVYNIPSMFIMQSIVISVRWDVLYAEFDGFFPHDNHPDLIKANLKEVEEFSLVGLPLNDRPNETDWLTDASLCTKRFWHLCSFSLRSHWNCQKTILRICTSMSRRARWGSITKRNLWITVQFTDPL